MSVRNSRVNPPTFPRSTGSLASTSRFLGARSGILVPAKGGSSKDSGRESTAARLQTSQSPQKLPVIDKPQVVVTKTGGGHQIKKRDGKTFYVSQEDYEYYKEAFNLFDRDKSGAIDLDELGAVMKSLGFTPSSEELCAMIDKVDADHTGTVEFDEFLEMSHDWMMQEIQTEEQIREAFEAIDLEGKGFISAETLGKLLDMLMPIHGKGHAEVADMIKEFDMDGDGVIGFDDFLAIMSSGA
ncbi:calmodulin-like protein [Geranomyces variabilis]|nr:calmodulin-like protein [Geranomyces variabilis]KAJ3142187.1 hypothetical protein HDU90_004460 [Geranomyces variabilis]